jgi:HAD superfamily hydrolase (TIGR01509 family)
MKRALISDWGGVLMRTVDIRPRMGWERELDLPPGGLAELFFASPAWGRAMRQPIPLRDVWTEVVGHLELPQESFDRLARDFWGGDRLDEDLVQLMRDLREEGVRTALLSNHSVELPGLLTELGVEDLFDVRMISALEGVAKPELAIFQRALERLEVAPGEAIFVDDWPVHVESAREAGIEAVRFRGTRNLRRALAAGGLPVDVPALGAVPDVRAIIFDWGGVIYPLTSHGRTDEWEERLGLERGRLGQVLWGSRWRQLEIGAISNEDFDRHVARSLGLPDRDAVHQFYTQFYGDGQVDRRMISAVQALRGRYRVGLLTNAFPGHAEMVKDRHGLDLHDAFDVVINSAEVGLAKPNPGVYHLMLDQLEVAPEQAIFLDDTVANADAARALGMHAIVVAEAPVALGDLQAMLGHPIKGGAG